MIERMVRQLSGERRACQYLWLNRSLAISRWHNDTLAPVQQTTGQRLELG